MFYSGNLGDSCRLYDWRTPLAFREPRRFILIGVDASELFAVSVEHADQKMVMLAAAIFAERGLALYPGLGYFSFSHFGHLIWRESQTALSQGNRNHTSTKRDSNTYSIREEKSSGGYIAE